MRSREPRRKVLINARMRSGASWSDARILNLSRRGMLVQASKAPARGSYLEIRRGPYVIVAHVVWADTHRFGIRTQDDVPAEGLANDTSRANPVSPPGAAPFVEQRARPRKDLSRHETSRQRSRAMEFATFGVLAALAAFFALGSVSELLGRPLAAIGLVLER